MIPCELTSDTFSISWMPINKNWCEFSIKIGDVWYRKIGGDVYENFRACLVNILKTPASHRIVNDKPFAREVGEDAGYFGYIFFSGYNTLYFFGDNKQVSQVVYANGKGVLQAYTTINSPQFYQWLEILALNP